MGYIYVMLAALCWAGLGPVAKFAFAEGIPPLEVAFWRAAFGLCFFLVHGLAAGLWRIKVRDLPMFALFGLFGVSVFFGSYQVAVREGGAAMAAILLYTAPAWVAVLSRMFLGEILIKAKIGAIGLAMVGATLVCTGSGGGLDHAVNLTGVLSGLVAGFTYALHYVFGKKFGGDYSTCTLYLYTLPVGLLGLLPFMEFTALSGTGADGQAITWVSWTAFLFLGLMGTYGAYLFYLAGLRRLDATRVAVVANLEPVTAALLAWLWWGEYFTVSGYVGGALVLTAVLFTVFDGRRRPISRVQE